MIINKQYFQDKDLEVKEKKQKLPVQEALIQGRKNVIKDIGANGKESPLPNNIIRYEASEKLTETTSNNSGGLHTNKFGTTMVSHIFADGVGTIEFEDDVTSIGDSAFYGCSGLTSVTIGNSVTSIGYSAFDGCSSLTSIRIPDSMELIKYAAFANCVNLVSVRVNCITPPSLPVAPNYQQVTFLNNASGRKIYVPAESVNAYKAASGWSTYASDIEAIP